MMLFFYLFLSVWLKFTICFIVFIFKLTSSFFLRVFKNIFNEFRIYTSSHAFSLFSLHTIQFYKINLFAFNNKNINDETAYPSCFNLWMHTERRKNHRHPLKRVYPHLALITADFYLGMDSTICWYRCWVMLADFDVIEVVFFVRLDGGVSRVWRASST